MALPVPRKALGQGRQASPRVLRPQKIMSAKKILGFTLVVKLLLQAALTLVSITRITR
jgi:hypothetical protein